MEEGRGLARGGGQGGCSPVAKSEVEGPRVFYFLGCTQTGDYPPEELVKFGYRKVMKIEGFKNPFLFWLPAGTCVWKSGDFFLI
jgi:hypothetical protein